MKPPWSSISVSHVALGHSFFFNHSVSVLRFCSSFGVGSAYWCFVMVLQYRRLISLDHDFCLFKRLCDKMLFAD